MKNIDIISRHRLDLFVCVLAFMTIEWTVLLIPVAAKEPTGVADFAFVDPLHGWVSIESPVPAILRTSDGGAHWSRFPLPFKHGFYLLRFFDLRTGVAVTDPTEGETLIYRTTDSGHTWKKIVRVENQSLVITGVMFVNADEVFAVGERPMGIGWVGQVRIDSGALRVRDDLPVDFSSQSNMLDVFGDGNHHVWIVGKQLILHSSNDGRTWENQYVHSNPHFDLGMAGWALPAGFAWFAAANFEIYATSNYGNEWSRVLTTVHEEKVNFDSIGFFDHEHGCAVGDSSFAYCTSDGGVSWSKKKQFQEFEPDKQSIRSKVLAFGSQQGVVSINGVLYKTKDAGNSFERVSLKSVTSIAAPKK